MESINSNPQTGCFYSFKETVSDITSRVINFVIVIFKALFSIAQSEKKNISIKALTPEEINVKTTEWMAKVKSIHEEGAKSYIEEVVKSGISIENCPYKYIFIVFYVNHVSSRTFAPDGSHSKFHSLLLEASQNSLIIGVSKDFEWLKSSEDLKKHHFEASETNCPWFPEVRNCDFLWIEGTGGDKNKIDYSNDQFVKRFAAHLESKRKSLENSKV